MNLNHLKIEFESNKEQTKPLPVLFIGHGSPMNAIEDNYFTREWSSIGQTIQTPRAILCISAHWLTRGSLVTAMDSPRTIHDFGGFPEELYTIEYPSPGAPEYAALTTKLISKTEVHLDYDWGLDHGTWSVLKHLYPEAKIPVYQLSIDYNKPAEYHFALAQELKQFRSKGVLIIGSGNIVHNLRRIAFNKPDEAFDWAVEFDDKVHKSINNKDYKSLVNYQQFGKSSALSVPTPDHYYPLLYALGATDKDEPVKYYAEKITMGSLSMRSLKIG